MEQNNIQYVEWGLANWYEDKIELNINLKKYPKLHDYILNHEKKHKKGFDLIHEFFLILNIKYLFMILLFCIKYPKTLIDLSPIWIKGNTLIYDLNKILLYSIALVCIIILILR